MTKLLICILSLIHFVTLAQQDVKPINQYVCPPCNSKCDRLEFEEAGTCKHCGMALVLKKRIITSNRTGIGQKLNVSKIDSFMNVLSKRGLAMGSLTISQNGKIKYNRALGYSYIDANKKVEATTNTKYRIGSVSKMFTAVMIFQLIEEGKIKLDQTLDVYYPDLPNSNKISIRNMLYHRSGLHDYTKDTGFLEWMDKPKTQEELFKIINEKGTDFEPNLKADYSNTNYLLLGYIIEKVCKMSYANVLQERVASKIGLLDTYYGNYINTSKNESKSYKYSNTVWKNEKETELSIHGGAGAIVSTPTDLVKFSDHLFAHKLVGKESLDIMKGLIDDYGAGMFADKYGSQPSFGHNGRIEEFYSALWYYPAEKLSIAYCTNGINFPRMDIMESILKICSDEQFELPFSKSSISQSEDLNRYAGNYSSKQVPMRIVCKNDDSKLWFEGNGKTFEVEPIGNNRFMNASNAYFFEFDVTQGQLIVKETDNVYYFKRNK